MSTVISVSPDMSLDDATDRMQEADISSVIVEPDERGQWGIMTQRDVVNKIVGINSPSADVKVSEITSKPLICVHRDTTLVEIAQLMMGRNIRRVGVEYEGKPIGIVSETDLFNIVQEFGWTSLE